MTEQEIELTEATVRLKKDGTLYQKIEGQETEVAKYDRATGHLEFATEEFSRKLYNQVTARIGTTNKGKDVSGFSIRSMSVKGEARPKLESVPKRPKLGPQGDAAEEVVQWYLDHDLAQAIIRYGIFTDKDGKPVRKTVRRIVQETVDNRDLDDSQLEWMKTDAKSQEKSPVQRVGEAFTTKNAVIARRATALTFTPEEVVGGFSLDDDGNPEDEA